MYYMSTWALREIGELMCTCVLWVSAILLVMIAAMLSEKGARWVSLLGVPAVLVLFGGGEFQSIAGDHLSDTPLVRCFYPSL